MGCVIVEEARIRKETKVSIIVIIIVIVVIIVAMLCRYVSLP